MPNPKLGEGGVYGLPRPLSTERINKGSRLAEISRLCLSRFWVSCLAAERIYKRSCPFP